MSQKPTIGRIVQYGIGRDHAGVVQYRPAIVVNDWGGNYSEGSGPNLQVFVDGTNDRHYSDIAAVYSAKKERLKLAGEVSETAAASALEEARRETSTAPSWVECERGVAWRTSVVEGDGVGQWRWPPRD